MYEFYKKFDQIPTKKNAGKNKKNILVIHHSGGPTFKSFYNTWKNPKNIGSYQFVIGEDGKSYKFGDPDDCAHHAGLSWRGPNHPNKDKKSINDISLGLCVIGPIEQGWFDKKQRAEAVKLTRYLVSMYKIGKENLVRHIDITQYNESNIKNKIYWTPWAWYCRKADISPNDWDWLKFVEEVYK